MEQTWFAGQEYSDIYFPYSKIKRYIYESNTTGLLKLLTNFHPNSLDFIRQLQRCSIDDGHDDWFGWKFASNFNRPVSDS